LQFKFFCLPLETLSQFHELKPSRIIPRQASGNSQAKGSLFSEANCIHDSHNVLRSGVNNYLILQYAKLIFGLCQIAASRRPGLSRNWTPALS
jgi:hypothetical protein